MKLRALLLFLFTAAIFITQAQPYTSTKGRFQVDEKKGCVPLTVTVTIILPFICNGANPCDMDFEGNNMFQSLTFTHTYAQAGTYNLRILFQTAGFDDIQIEVTPNIQPDFDIYYCGGNEVSLKITDTNYNQYIIDYNDGSPTKLVPSGSLAKDNHTFASSGAKNITVRGRNLNADDNCSPMTKPITAVLTLPAPTINLLTALSSSQIQLDFATQQNILYKLEVATNNNTTFQQLLQVYNSATATISNLRTDDNYYCFRLGAFDPCNNITVYSNTICSANFDVTAQGDLTNKLVWVTSSNGVSNYSVSKTPGSPLSALSSATSLDDSPVICKTDYRYQLTSNYTNGSKSISLEKPVTAFSNSVPTAVNDITAVVGPTGVDLEWLQDPSFTPVEYSIFRSNSLLTTTISQQVSDAGYTTDANFCYKINYKDICDNTSAAGTEVCPIRLTGSLQKDNSISLSWPAYTGWKNGVNNYIVEKYSSQGQLLQSFNVGSATSLLDDAEDLSNQIYVYLVKANANDGGLNQAVSNAITIIKEPNLFYPTAFTPNKDGLNDTFKVFGQYLVGFKMNIFNRWGELMYSTADVTQGWDGTYKGNPMTEGTYAFVAEITDQAGRTFTRSGSVVLLQKK